MALVLAAGIGMASAIGLAAPGRAVTPATPAPLAPIVGEEQSHLVEPGETVLDVAYRHRLGFDNVQRLNPRVKVWIPDPGTIVRLPTRMILPDGPQRGLVINVPEMRLYDFTRPGEPEVLAIAIGDEVDPSLLGELRIGAKRENPAWHVPKSILAEKPELPPVVPPGPDNPLGTRWMTIGSTSYGVHGTNNPWSIGREATHGCIRLYDDEMERLYARTPSGTRLRLQYQRVKLGTDGEDIWAEAHPDVYGREPDALEGALARLAELGLLGEIDRRLLAQVIVDVRGVPVRVGTLPPDGGLLEPGR